MYDYDVIEFVAGSHHGEKSNTRSVYLATGQGRSFCLSGEFSQGLVRTPRPHCYRTQRDIMATQSRSCKSATDSVLCLDSMLCITIWRENYKSDGRSGLGKSVVMCSSFSSASFVKPSCILIMYEASVQLTHCLK